MLENRLRQWLGEIRIDEPLYLVGGSVRDLLLERPVKDIDLASASAKSIAFTIARAKNAALVPMEKDPKAPCYRIVNKKSPEDFLDITQIRDADILGDLSQRDFSINAMALPVENNMAGSLKTALIDPMSGKKDLENRVIRSLGKDNLIDDPLRILRAFRFAAQLNFSIEEKTLADCAQIAPDLCKAAFERILNELFQLMNSPKSAPLVRLMSDAKILDHIFPEITPMRACAQNGFHHADVWEHSLETYKGCEDILNDLEKMFEDNAENIRKSLSAPNRAGLIKFAALIHDAGKPGTAKYDSKKGRTTFIGHARAGEVLARGITKRLRMKNRDRDFVRLLVAEHLHTEQLARPEVKEKTRMAWFRKLGDMAVACAILAIADTQAKRGKLCTVKERSQRIARIKKGVAAYFGGIKQTLEKPLLINGKDLMAMGVPQGKAVGRLLKKIQSAQDTGRINTRDQALELAKTLTDGADIKF